MSIQKITFKVEIMVEPDGEQFHSWCPALKGLHSCGDTKEEALLNARNAVEAYLQSILKHGDPIPLEYIVRQNSGRMIPAIESHHYTESVAVAGC